MALWKSAIEMPAYGWPNCPVTVSQQVDRLSSAVTKILGDQITGVYLHGSLAMGCFNPQRSDLDLLVTTRERMPNPIKRRIVEALLASSLQPHPIEISFLAWSQLFPWRYPTPYDLHYSEMWRGRYERDLISGAWQAWDAGDACDPDLAAHITMLHARGLCLAGVPVSDAFPPVPAGDYLASLAVDIDESLAAFDAGSGDTDPVYAILNCCRTLAYLREGQFLSKEEGGTWALHTLSRDLHEPVRHALASYRTQAEDRRFDPSVLNVFVLYMRQTLTPLWHSVSKSAMPTDSEDLNF